MKLQQILNILNASATGNSISFDKEIIPMISDFLTENNIKNSDKLINLILQQPALAQMALPTVFRYFVQKHHINTVSFNNKILLYYVSD